ncbi:lipoprotein [Burkholderia aenigmatica]|uniref:Lipoprotein n=2 Tax=Burkholderiaceae TaxID=119060 RepID=A0ABY6Y4P0_9BURK|nr:lipoprotein [Burkholderia aenigmatica]VWD36993.1 lipoprotein [Burkholderia aenigmatica]
MNGQAGNDMNNEHQRNTRAGRIAILGAIVGVAMSTAAAYGQQVTRPGVSDVNGSTRAWLSMQRDNRAAAPTQPMLGDVASLVYQRYLDSFKNKIPNSMSSQIGSTSGGMSGGGQAAQ